MRIATESSYHHQQNDKVENEKLYKGMDRIFGKPWYEETDPEEAARKRKEKGL
jgi:hypothetical protein